MTEIGRRRFCAVVVAGVAVLLGTGCSGGADDMAAPPGDTELTLDGVAVQVRVDPG
jgi:hypothetical protein